MAASWRRLRVWQRLRPALVWAEVTRARRGFPWPLRRLAVACQSLPRLARAQFAGDRWHPAASQWNALPAPVPRPCRSTGAGRPAQECRGHGALLRAMIGAGVFGRRVVSLGGKAGYIDLAAAARLAFGDRLRPIPGRRDDCPWAIATFQKKCQQTDVQGNAHHPAPNDGVAPVCHIAQIR